MELNEAQLIFNVGLIDFETSLLGKVEQQEKVIDLSHGIDLIEGSCSHSSHGHNHTHGVDRSRFCIRSVLSALNAAVKLSSARQKRAVFFMAVPIIRNVNLHHGTGQQKKNVRNAVK